MTWYATDEFDADLDARSSWVTRAARAVSCELQKLEKLPTPAAAGGSAELRALRETYVREIAEARNRLTQR